MKNNEKKSLTESRILYDYSSAAYQLSMSPQALRTAVCRNQGPRKTKRGGRVYFHRKDLENYADALRNMRKN